MRLPLSFDLVSRDGVTDANARMTNVLKEVDDTRELAAIRPALESVVSASGNGNGLVCYNGVLISVFGTTAGYGESPTTISTVGNGKYDFVQSPI